MWTLAGGDYDKALRVWRWPVRAALRACLERFREDEIQEYRLALVLYAIAAQWDPKAKKPEIPPLLREVTLGG